MLGEKGRRIRELTAVVQKRFGFPEGSVEVSWNIETQRKLDVPLFLLQRGVFWLSCLEQRFLTFCLQ